MIEAKKTKLLKIMEKYDNAVIAFSGGCDSSYLLYIAKEAGIKFCAVTFDTNMYPEKELDEAKKLTDYLGINHQIIKVDPLNIPELKNNPPERCYICKKSIFGNLIALAAKDGYKYIIDGSNADDVNDYRPGRTAALELGVKSPLEEAGFTKMDIRFCLRELNFPLWEKPSMACYFSRFPYGAAVDENMVRMVSCSEHELHKLGLVSARVRHHGVVARIEAGSDDMEKIYTDESLRLKIIFILKNAGFIYVSLDLEGYRSGAMNEVLK